MGCYYRGTGNTSPTSHKIPVRLAQCLRPCLGAPYSCRFNTPACFSPYTRDILKNVLCFLCVFLSIGLSTYSYSLFVTVLTSLLLYSLYIYIYIYICTITKFYIYRYTYIYICVCIYIYIWSPPPPPPRSTLAGFIPSQACFHICVH